MIQAGSARIGRQRGIVGQSKVRGVISGRQQPIATLGICITVR